MLTFDTAIEFMEFLKEVEFTYGGKVYDISKYVDNIVRLLQFSKIGE